jgi:hypothetical protein
VDFKGSPEWFGENDHEKPSGLGEAPLTYDPPVTADSKLAYVKEDNADQPEHVRCWLQSEPARKLPNVAKVPTIVITSEASYHAPYDHCTVAYLRQAGIKVAHVRLAEQGVHGNGHMMMLEKNNRAIARVMADWLDRLRDGARPDRLSQR